MSRDKYSVRQSQVLYSPQDTTSAVFSLQMSALSGILYFLLDSVT